MAYASKSGRARTRASDPQAFGVCMRCGIWYNRVELKNQFAWQGAALLPTWLFVCPTCMDIPQENDRAIVLPPDPIPIQLALPEDFDAASSTVMTLSEQTIDPQTGLPVFGNTAMQTTDGVLMSPTPTGRPPGYYALAKQPVTPNDVVVFMAKTDGTGMAQVDGTNMATEQQGPGPPVDDDGLPPLEGIPIPVVSLMADGTPLVRATCRAAHGLTLNSQIAVRGSENPLADGVFSVIPLTATAFTYGTYSPIPAGTILGPETLIVATQMGLPRQFQAVPQTGLQQSVIPTKTSQ